MKLKDNLSSIISQTVNTSAPPSFIQVGKVYGVVTGKDTPTKLQFEKVGGFSKIGAIFYLDYDVAKDIPFNFTDDFFNICKIAYPFSPHNQYYPLLGELVLLEDLPAIASQVTNNSTQKYYVGVINVWNNTQHNSQLLTDQDQLGKTFQENPNIRNLKAYEGDYIIRGRSGNAIRFGSTVLGSNEWSKVGTQGDPITIISAGHNYVTSSLDPYSEQINQDKSSIWLTTNQQVPLIPDKSDSLNKLTNPVSVPTYQGAQIVFNSDRIIINSKRDEVIICAKSNVEFATKNIINLNADNRVHINGNRNFIGSKVDGTLPDEPLMLGNQTIMLLSELMSGMHQLCSTLSSAVSSAEGTPLVDINVAANILMPKLEVLTDKLKTIISKNNYTS